MRGKPKYLIKQKKYTAEKDTQEGLENLGNTIDLVKKFKKEINEEKIRKVQTRKDKRKEKVLNPEAEVFKRSELLGKYTTKILFEQNDRKFRFHFLLFIFSLFYFIFLLFLG